MRRTAIVVALLAALAIFAAPASAQVQDGWFLNAGVGPAFGTLGSVPAIDGPPATGSTNTSQWRENSVCCHMLLLIRRA
jgi:hypothetical protein